MKLARVFIVPLLALLVLPFSATRPARASGISGGGGDEDVWDDTTRTLTTPSTATSAGTFAIAEASDPTTAITLWSDTTTGIRAFRAIAVDLELATTGFDAVATAGDVATITVEGKVDATNYRQLDTANFTSGSIGNNFLAVNLWWDEDVRVTVTVDTDRGAFNLPYRVIYARH